MNTIESASGFSTSPRDMAEYNALRQEILERIKLRQQVIGATLVLAAALLGVGVKLPTVALIYPPLAAFLALAWAQNDYRIRDIAGYVMEFFECDSTKFGWEHHVREHRNRKGLGTFRVVVAAHGGLFLVTQFLAIGLGVAKLASQIQPPWVLSPFPWFTMSSVLAGLLVIDIACVGVVVWTVHHAQK